MLVIRVGVQDDDGASRHPITDAVMFAFGDVAPVYELTSNILGVLMPGVTKRQAMRTAEAVGHAIRKRQPDGAQVSFAAGAAAFHREDDPATVLCLARKCLRTAGNDGQSVVGSRQGGAQAPPRVVA